MFELTPRSPPRPSQEFNVNMLGVFPLARHYVRHCDYNTSRVYINALFSQFRATGLVGMPNPERKYSMTPLNTDAGYAETAKFSRPNSSIIDPAAEMMARISLINTYSPYAGDSGLTPKREVIALMNMQSGVGYPENIKFRSKDAFFRNSIDYETKMSYYDAAMATRRPIPAPFTNSVKYEIRSSEKIENNQLRTFLAGNVYNLALDMQYFHEMRERMRLHNDVLPHSIGASHFYGGWGELARYLHFDNEYNSDDGLVFIEIDYTGWDRSLTTAILQNVKEVQTKLLKREITSNETHSIVIDNLFLTKFCALVIMEHGELIQFDNGNTSGQGGTLTDNCIANDFCWRYALWKMNPNMTQEEFRKYFRTKMMGDDFIAGVKMKRVPWFSPDKFAVIAAELGLIFKRFKVYPTLYTTVVPAYEGPSYLSKQFVIRDGYVMGLPERAKIFDNIEIGNQSGDVRYMHVRLLALIKECYPDKIAYENLKRFEEQCFERSKAHLMSSDEELTYQELVANRFSEYQLFVLHTGVHSVGSLKAEQAAVLNSIEFNTEHVNHSIMGDRYQGRARSNAGVPVVSVKLSQETKKEKASKTKRREARKGKQEAYAARAGQRKDNKHAPGSLQSNPGKQRGPPPGYKGPSDGTKMMSKNSNAGVATTGSALVIRNGHGKISNSKRKLSEGAGWERWEYAGDWTGFTPTTGTLGQNYLINGTGNFTLINPLELGTNPATEAKNWVFFAVDELDMWIVPTTGTGSNTGDSTLAVDEDPADVSFVTLNVDYARSLPWKQVNQIYGATPFVPLRYRRSRGKAASPQRKWYCMLPASAPTGSTATDALAFDAAIRQCMQFALIAMYSAGSEVSTQVGEYQMRVVIEFSQRRIATTLPHLYVEAEVNHSLIAQYSLWANSNSRDRSVPNPLMERTYMSILYAYERVKELIDFPPDILENIRYVNACVKALREKRKALVGALTPVAKQMMARLPTTDPVRPAQAVVVIDPAVAAGFGTYGTNALRVTGGRLGANSLLVDSGGTALATFNTGSNATVLGAMTVVQCSDSKGNIIYMPVAGKFPDEKTLINNFAAIPATVIADGGSGTHLIGSAATQTGLATVALDSVGRTGLQTNPQVQFSSGTSKVFYNTAGLAPNGTGTPGEAIMAAVCPADGGTVQVTVGNTGLVNVGRVTSNTYGGAVNIETSLIPGNTAGTASKVSLVDSSGGAIGVDGNAIAVSVYGSGNKLAVDATGNAGSSINTVANAVTMFTELKNSSSNPAKVALYDATGSTVGVTNGSLNTVLTDGGGVNTATVSAFGSLQVKVATASESTTDVMSAVSTGASDSQSIGVTDKRVLGGPKGSTYPNTLTDVKGLIHPNTPVDTNQKELTLSTSSAKDSGKDSGSESDGDYQYVALLEFKCGHKRVMAWSGEAPRFCPHPDCRKQPVVKMQPSPRHQLISASAGSVKRSRSASAKSRQGSATVQTLN